MLVIWLGFVIWLASPKVCDARVVVSHHKRDGQIVAGPQGSWGRKRQEEFCSVSSWWQLTRDQETPAEGNHMFSRVVVKRRSEQKLLIRGGWPYGKKYQSASRSESLTQVMRGEHLYQGVNKEFTLTVDLAQEADPPKHISEVQPVSCFIAALILMN